MESIYKYDETHLCVHFDVLVQKDLKAEDFLGTTTIFDNKYLRVQDNYFNQMLLGTWGAITTCTSDEVIPEGLASYQIVDVHKSICLGTFCNFNRMGYGKTVETIAHLKTIRAQKVLIVAPKAVLDQWKREIQTWYPEMYPYTVIVKSAAALRGQLEFVHNSLSVYQCIITNYEKLLQGPVITQLKQNIWDLIVFDEAHMLKNRNSKRSQAAKLIPAKNRCLLTGTPVMSHYDDLWSMLYTLGWRYSGQHYWPWVEKFCETRQGFFGKEIVGPTRNERDLEHFKKYIDLISIRNPDLKLTKGKRIITVPLQMEKTQRTFYNKIKKLVIDELPENLTIANGAVKVIRLRQATSCPQILDFEQKPGVKFEWIKNFVECTEEQVLILTQFSSTVNKLALYLDKVKTSIYYGSLSDTDKRNALEAFKQKETQVLIATMQSIGTGVDGLQACCRLGIVIDAGYSPENNSQAEDRLNRLGQKDQVIWYYLECAKTFDTRVRKINDCKNKSIRELLLEKEED